jgi:hypothetical protein
MGSSLPPLAECSQPLLLCAAEGHRVCAPKLLGAQQGQQRLQGLPQLSAG